MTKVVVVDYGMGNIKNVQRGLEKVGATVEVSSCNEVISSADCLVLPGVGAFEAGMNGLREAGVIQAIDEFAQSGKPLLGICLGMQMLLDRSNEHGSHEGLGYIPGVVNEVPHHREGVPVRKIPHIGWSALIHPAHRPDWSDSILGDINVGDYFYFVHSYMAAPDDSKDILAQCEYEGYRITAAIQRANITGLQFHPEKSGELGLRILERFVRY